MFYKSDKEKLKQLHDALIDKLTDAERICQKFSSSLTKSDRQNLSQSIQNIKTSVSDLKDTIDSLDPVLGYDDLL